MEVHAHLVIAPSLEDASIPPKLKKETADIRHLITDSLNIKDARWLIEESSKRPLGDIKHHFIIVAGTITLEAQNALLKLLEEPPRDSVFYLIVPHESMLLPTLCSRLIRTIDALTNTDDKEGRVFMKLPLKDQLEFIADRAKKDPESLRRLAKQIALEEQQLTSPEAKRSLLQTLTYVYNRGASRKMLLEELALSLHTKQK